jgi:GT2 family glycosyltransferase/glycosyltransferase involved in cell wall biosynthesis
VACFRGRGHSSVPAVADLKPVRVLFASGTADLNRAMLEQFAQVRPDLALCVVSEFEPGNGEWIPWHVHRSFDQNLAYVRTALAGRRIETAAVAYDNRSALGDLRKAARILAPGFLIAYDEEMRRTSPLSHALLRIGKQLGTDSRTRAWLRRITHPREAEIPIRARLAMLQVFLPLWSRRLRLPARHEPRPDLQPGITVVIPSRDGRDLLQEMLPPILTQLTTGEIIVVDNGSSDGTPDFLAREHPYIRVLRHDQPLSFANAVNQGIHEARYNRTLLLNNDMLAEPGFIAALDDAFHQVPDLFCSTAQILFPPGVRREETGKAVWRRTNDLDFPVRCDDPIPGEDLTWVLYGSGGCSLFDTAKLVALGGVSELYDPAYVEDLDFGYRAWKRGWPSVYCALARVEHRHRSTTSRFYSERQIDFFVERNYLRFLANAVTDPGLFRQLWVQAIRRLQLQAMQGRAAALDALRDVPKIAPARESTAHLSGPAIFALTNGDVAVFQGAQHPGQSPVLIASPYLPYPLSHGGAVRIYNLMKLAAETSDLILVAFTDELAPPPPELLAICSQIVLVRRRGTHYRRDTARPDMVEEFESETFRVCLQQAVHQWRPAIAQLEFTWMAQYADACRPAKTILIEHDVTFELQEQLLQNAPPGGTARLELEQQLVKWRTFETEAWRNVDCVVTMSAKDTQTITGARVVECLPNGVDCKRFQPTATDPEPRRLLLIGSFAHLPNLLALEFFLRDVWPLLGPGYTLHVIGGARHDYYLDFFRDRVAMDLAQPGIELEGFVADVRSAYTRAAIVLAPLTASAGTNIKVLEAMAMGKVLVSTPTGVNGLDLKPGCDFLLAETGAVMAQSIRLIEDDPVRRKQIEANARHTALQFDWREIARRQTALYKRLRC